MALLHRPGTVAMPTTQVIGPNQAGQQQHGGQLDTDKVRPVEGDTHLLRRYDPGAGGRAPGLAQDVEQLPDEDRRQDRRSDPHARPHPPTLLRDGCLPQIEQHHHEDKQHHDRPGVDDDLERRDERRPQYEENHCDGQERHDQVQQGMHRVQPGDHHDGGGNGHSCGDIENDEHQIGFPESLLLRQ